ncbi:MAG: efflux RND transporter periplasmic adaptor subunit [Chloroflexi bacterium]|nr:efflux RND transporter periplasmic adaptor subunit [Chloroflexota bacterium]
MRARYLPAIIFILLFVIAGFMYLQYVSTPRLPEGFVFASGNIEGIEYQASTRIPGKVVEMRFREGDIIKKGDLIGVLESKQLKAAVQAAKANVEVCKVRLSQAMLGYHGAAENSRSTIRQAGAGIGAATAGVGQADAVYNQSKASVGQAEAQVKEAEAVYNKEKKNYERYNNLLKAEAVSENEFENAGLGYTSAKERLNVALKQVESAKKAEEAALFALSSAREQKDQSSAAMLQARATSYNAKISQKDINSAGQMLKEAYATLESAKADYEDSRIYSPVNGRVIYRLIEPGEVVGAGAPLMTIVDLESLYLKVFIPNEQVGKLKVGDPGKIYPDAYPKKSFEGKIERIATEAEFMPKNVQTREQRAQMVFEVRIKVIENPGGDLKPGMPAETLIQYDKNASFNKAEEVRKKMK